MLNVAFCILLVLSLIIFAAVIVTILKKGFGPYITDMRQPVIKTQATVVSKREETADSFRHNFERRFGDALDPSDAVRVEPVEWYVTLKPDEDQSSEFAVSQAMYESLIIGDKGELTRRGRLLVRFAPQGMDSASERPEKTVPDSWL